MEWLRDNWLRLHLAISPLGTLIVTWLLLFSVGAGQWWDNRDNLESAGQITPFGGIIYGSAIFVLEITVRMLWALAQRQKDIDKARLEGEQKGREEGVEEGRQEGIAEGRQEGIAEGRQEGKAEGRQEGKAEGRQEGREQMLRELAERGINLPPEILEDLKKNYDRC